MLAAVLLLPPAGPRGGTVLLLVSSSAGDSLGGGRLALLDSRSSQDLGPAAGSVPKAPELRTLAQVEVVPGRYSGVRVGGLSLPAAIVVRRGQVEPVLIGFAGGRPLAGGVWAGSDQVNLGLSELSGQKTALADFNLSDQFGSPLTRDSLAGHRVILAAFHTSCRETCPLYTGMFFQLQRSLGPGDRLLEVTTDPARDTPQVLRDYATSIGAGWTFGTGAADELAGFWSQFGVGLSGLDEHASTLAIVDSHGYLRLVYRGVPDVGGNLPVALQDQLSPAGLAELRSHGEGWGPAQLLDALKAIDGLARTTSGPGAAAPDFDLPALEGGTRISLGSLRGRPLVINFFASWCQPCRSELPLLEKEAAANPGVTFVLVNSRDGPDPGPARALLAGLRIHTPLAVRDTPEGRVSNQYAVFGLPSTVFVRSDGSVEDRVAGQLDAATLGAHRAAIQGG